MTNKWDFETDNKEAKRILRTLEVWITKNYGKRCKKYANGCPVCRVWLAFDNLKCQL